MTVVFTDSFTGAVNTPINGRVGSGGTWSCAGLGANDIAGLKINAANQAKIATSNGCLGRVETNTANHYAKANIWTLTSAAAVAVRAVDHLNFIGFRVTGSTQVELFRRIGGVETSVIKLAVAALSAPVLLQATITGTMVTLGVNGAAVGLAGGYAVTDTVFTGVTRVGLWGRSSGVDPLADDFEAGTVAGAVALMGPASARSATTDRNKAVGIGFAIGPVRARSGTTDRGVGLVTGVPLGPGGSRLAARDRNAALAASYAVRAASARLATIDRNAAVRAAGAIATGTATIVPAELRAVQAGGEIRTIAVSHD